LKIFIAAVVAVMSTAIHAQVHVCKDAQGRKIYSDAPCGTDDTIVDIKSPTGGPKINPNESVNIERYDIRGKTYDELIREIQLKAPEGSWAGTDPRISYRYMTRKTPKGCVIDTVIVNADSTIHMPNWIDRYAAPASLQTWWDGAYRSMEMHERNHLQICRDSAREMERMLKTVPEQPTCEDLNDLARKRANRIYSDHEQKQQEYDVRTDHGKNERTPYR
jgi:predicted secreted Zn-dependent protease